ncbi:nucleotidyltransferase domain-containing protein [Deinococcus frigens]|uniref:nucleotidyltransferase domain-containing protein n=1 Tax=Deinococcus frigens TaxID=249403 RepID=UPI00049667A2|nr:nucleotidyltransferase family protein [Deinococcus frigens]
MLHPQILSLCRAFAEAGVKVWLIGGQAVELLCGGNVREHDDIDFLVREADGVRATDVLRGIGFFKVHGSLEEGNVFFYRDGLLVDLVPIHDELNPPRTVGRLDEIAWPADFLAPFDADLDDLAILTLTPASHRAMKGIVAAFYGAEMRDKDCLDLSALATLAP